MPHACSRKGDCKRGRGLSENRGQGGNGHNIFQLPTTAPYSLTKYHSDGVQFFVMWGREPGCLSISFLQDAQVHSLMFVLASRRDFTVLHRHLRVDKNLPFFQPFGRSTRIFTFRPFEASATTEEGEGEIPGDACPSGFSLRTLLLLPRSDRVRRHYYRCTLQH